MVLLFFRLLWFWLMLVICMVLLILMVLEFGCFLLVSMWNRVDLFVLLLLIILMMVFLGMFRDRLLISMWLLQFLVILCSLMILLFRCGLVGMQILLVLLCFWNFCDCSFLKCCRCVLDLVWWFLVFWCIYFSLVFMVLVWEVFCLVFWVRWVVLDFSQLEQLFLNGMLWLWLSLRIQLVMLLRKQWLWVIVIMVLGKLCRKCFSQVIELVFRWLVGLFSSSMLGVDSSRWYSVMWCFLLLDRCLILVFYGGRCRVLVVIFSWCFRLCLLDVCRIVFSLVCLVVRVLKLVFGLVQVVQILFSCVWVCLIWLMVFLMMLCMVVCGFSLGFCGRQLMLIFGIGWVLFLILVLMLVMICSRVDLFVLFRLSMLILVLGKNDREMFLRILCLGGMILLI